MRILIAEDEELLANSIKYLLESHKYEADVVYDGSSVVDYVLTEGYDLLILDVMLPETDGYQVAKALRDRRVSIPILMLTARSELEDRIQGLEAGADYYLTKPFDTRELLACVAALLRRQGTQINQLVFGDTCLDLCSGNLICGENRIRLSAKEFDVARMLFQSRSRNVPKWAILNKVWGLDTNAMENHVEVYVGFIRRKLARIKSRVYVQSVRRMGYHLEYEMDDD